MKCHWCEVREESLQCEDCGHGLCNSPECISDHDLDCDEPPKEE